MFARRLGRFVVVLFGYIFGHPDNMGRILRRIWKSLNYFGCVGGGWADLNRAAVDEYAIWRHPVTKSAPPTGRARRTLGSRREVYVICRESPRGARAARRGVAMLSSRWQMGAWLSTEIAWAFLDEDCGRV